jgi:tRNA wybutosine-synthesizing protein 3
MQSSKIPLPQSFIAKKKIILNQLSVPISEYDDLSPKGSVDEGIRDLIDEINRIEGCVTTSSCSGRVSVFLEGKKQVHGEELDGSLREGSESGVRETTAGVGGKGGGGRWLYVSHNEVDITQHDGAEGSLTSLLGMEQSHDGLRSGAGIRFIHFKFEPMVCAQYIKLHYIGINSLLTILRSFIPSRPHLSMHR